MVPFTAWTESQIFSNIRRDFHICSLLSYRDRVYRYADSARLVPAAGRSYIKGPYRLSPRRQFSPRIPQPTDIQSSNPISLSPPPLIMARSSQTPIDRKRRLTLPCNRCSTVSILDWRMQLNNFLQVNGGTARLQYVEIVNGPAHKPTWHCTAYSESGAPQCRVCSGLPP